MSRAVLRFIADRPSRSALYGILFAVAAWVFVDLIYSGMQMTRSSALAALVCVGIASNFTSDFLRWRGCPPLSMPWLFLSAINLMALFVLIGFLA